MILSKSKYAVVRPTVTSWIEQHPDADLSRAASHLSIATHCPIIVVLEFMMEVVGRTEELEARQESMMTYYGDEIGE